ncbi:hypothetical protein ACX80A_14485 [Arthrobacter sp. TMN-50]
MTNIPARWSIAVGSAGTLSEVSNGVLYTGGDGYSAVFTPVAGSTSAFTPPAGVKANLVKTSTGHTLTSRTTSQVTTFDADGRTIGMADRNGNTTTVAHNSVGPTRLTSTAGPVEARTATLSYGSLGILESIKRQNVSKAMDHTLQFHHAIGRNSAADQRSCQR